MEEKGVWIVDQCWHGINKGRAPGVEGLTEEERSKFNQQEAVSSSCPAPGPSPLWYLVPSWPGLYLPSLPPLPWPSTVVLVSPWPRGDQRPRKSGVSLVEQVSRIPDMCSNHWHPSSLAMLLETSSVK